MKYFLILLLSTTAYAQELDSLEQFYSSNMLIVQTHRGGWKPILGYNPINEAQFFTIAGMNREAQFARSKKSLGKKLLFTGISLAVIGGVLNAKYRVRESRFKEPFTRRRPSPETVIIDEGNRRLRIVGYFGVGTGIIFSFIGGKKLSSNWAPKKRAEELADLYNKNLRKQLGLRPNK